MDVVLVWQLFRAWIARFMNRCPADPHEDGDGEDPSPPRSRPRPFWREMDERWMRNRVRNVRARNPQDSRTWRRY